MKCKEKDALGLVEHTKYRSGVGKMMHVMQYSLSQTYNAVRVLVRHIAQIGLNRGLVLKPDTK